MLVVFDSTSFDHIGAITKENMKKLLEVGVMGNPVKTLMNTTPFVAAFILYQISSYCYFQHIWSDDSILCNKLMLLR